MGRLLFFLFASLVIVLVYSLIVKVLDRKKKMTKEEKRKSFDADVEAVAKKIKMRQ